MSMEYLDILFFALVAVFVALRLRGVLGTRTGHERPPEETRNPLSPRSGDTGFTKGFCSMLFMLVWYIYMDF